MARWLQYWLIFSVFSSVAFIFDMVGDNGIFPIPFYYEAKVAFVLWLILDKFKGATLPVQKVRRAFPCGQNGRHRRADRGDFDQGEDRQGGRLHSPRRRSRRSRPRSLSRRANRRSPTRW